MRVLPRIVAGLVLCYSARASTINATVSGFGQGEAHVLDTVIDFWERALRNPITISVSVRMLDLQGDLLGVSSGFTEDEKGTPTGAVIQVDNRQGSVIGWFVDSTPEFDEEYYPGVTPWHRRGRRPGKAGEDYDLLTVLQHEMTHVFGFSIEYKRFNDKVGPSEFESLRSYNGDAVTATLTSEGEGTHLSDAIDPYDLMTAFQSRGERILPSDLDMAILSDAFGYTFENSTTAALPEATGFRLTVAGLMILLMLRRHSLGKSRARNPGNRTDEQSTPLDMSLRASEPARGTE